MTTTTDWPTGSSDHAASNVKTATIIQFVPRANPDRPTLTEAEELEAAEFLMHSQALIGTDCGNLGHPWSGEDKA